MHGRVPEHVRGDGRPHRRGRPPDADLTAFLRSLPGSGAVWHGCGPPRHGDTAADLRRGALRNLFPVSRDRGRVLRLRAGAGTTTGSMANLRPRIAGADPAQGLSRQRRAPAWPHVTLDTRLTSERFPRASRYNPDWVLAGASGGANALWITEWLTGALNLKAGMRVLDLACG